MTGTIITKKGIQLLVKLMATKGELVFNRVGIGIGLLPTGYDPASMIDLVNYKMDGAISRCEADSDVAKITMQVSSIGVETGFTMTEIGIFAEDPDVGEILYSYLDLQEDPQYIYAEGGDAEKYIEITLEVAIEESTKVSAYINPDSLVTRQEFEKQLLNFKEEIKGGLEKIDFDDSGEIEGIESFTDFMSSFVKGTNIYQFFSNLKAGLNYVLHAGQLVNSGMCETPGMFPLDAAFGKTLQDQITGLYSEITGLNLKDQELQNALAALDTRVTNAINGGDLAPKVTIDLLNTPYTDSTDSSYAVQSAQKSLSVVCDVKNCTTQRVWNYPIKITKGMKLIYNVSGAQYGQGSSVKSSGIRIGSNVIGFGSGTIDLAPYLNQTLTFSAFLVGYAGSTVINFNKMTVTNA